MRIENVELTNMRTFAQAKYKVPQGLSLVTGQNGTGKSTLLGIAVAWVVWGQTPGRTQDFLVRHGERELGGRLTFNSNVTKYRLTRRFRLNKNGKGGITQLLFHADNQFGDEDEKKWIDLTGATVKETQAKINYVAGSFEVWQMTAYVSQREGAGQFLEANAYDRKGILREIIAGVGDWDQWEYLAKQKVSHYEAEILRIEGAIPVITEAAEPLNAVTQTLTAARTLGVETDIARDKSAEIMRRSSAAIERGREVVAEWAKRDGDLKVAKERLAQFDTQITAFDTNIASLRKSAEQLGHINADYKAHQAKIAERQTEINAVIAANEASALADAEAFAANEAATATWRTEHETWIAKRDTRMNEISDRFAALKKVKVAKESVKANYCPECKQPLTEKHSEELLNLIAENPDWESEMAGLNTEYGDLASAMPPQAPEATPLNVQEPVPQQLSQNEKIIELRTKAENANELIATQQIQKDSLTGQASEIRVKVVAMERWIEAAERPAENYMAKLLEAGNTAHETDRLALEAANVSTRNIALAEQAVEAATKAKNELSEKRSSLGNHKVQLHEWEIVALMCGTNGIRQLIIDQALAQLEPACNRWLAIIAPGFEIAFSTQTDTARETFEEGVILPSGAIQPWSELSGAQSVAVALAVRLGLAEVGGTAQGIHYETLYLDEADAWLTGDYQQQFMDMLAKVADTGIDVVAITHIEAVKQMVDQQVEVVSNGNESRIK